jgi:hypothetical protein
MGLSSKLSTVVGVGLLGSFISWAVLRERSKEEERVAWRHRVEAVRTTESIWSALLSVDPCLRSGEWGAAALRRSMAADGNAERGVYSLSSANFNVGASCMGREQPLDGLLPAAALAALAAWRQSDEAVTAPANALSTYFSGRDFEEDHFKNAPALIAAMTAALDARGQVLAQVRKTVLPRVNEQIRDLQRLRKAQRGQDEGWWRVELHLSLQALHDQLDVAAERIGKPDEKETADAFYAGMQGFLSQSQGAPIEVRRDVRKLEFFTAPAAAHQPIAWLASHFPSLELLGEARYKPLVPAPDPGPQPEEDSD